MSCFITHYASPLGRLLLAADEEGLTGLWLEGQKYFGGRTAAAKGGAAHAGSGRGLPLAGYLLYRPGAGFYSAAASCGLGFSAGGVAASAADPLWADHHLWRAGRGTGAAARLTHFSAQAVGGAVGHNRVSIIIPATG